MIAALVACRFVRCEMFVGRSRLATRREEPTLAMTVCSVHRTGSGRAAEITMSQQLLRACALKNVTHNVILQLRSSDKRRKLYIAPSTLSLRRMYLQ